MEVSAKTDWLRKRVIAMPPLVWTTTINSFNRLSPQTSEQGKGIPTNRRQQQEENNRGRGGFERL